MTALTKVEVARRQLGSALWLFLQNLDPVSVHTLAGSGAELAEGLARDVGGAPFIEHVLRTNPDMTQQRYYALARQHYNALKHLTKRDGANRDDAELLSTFTDEKNDALLFIGWTDLTAAAPSVPIEAQVYLVWFYASYPDKMARKEDAEKFLSLFPGLTELSRAERKAALRRQIDVARTNLTVMNDPGTDQRPLIWEAA